MRPVVVESSGRRLVVELRPSVGELRRRVAGSWIASFVLFFVLVGLLLAFRWALLGTIGWIGPTLVAAVVGAVFLRVRVRRVSSVESLVVDRQAGRIEFRSPIVAPDRLPRPIDLANVTGVRVVKGEGGYHREVALTLDGGRALTCISLSGRRPSDEEIGATDRALDEVVEAIETFLQLEGE